MVIIYLFIFCVMLLGMNILAIRARKEKQANPTIVRVTGDLIAAVNVTVISSILATFLPIKETALFMQCIHYASTEWVLICLLRFMEGYTKDMFAKNWTRIIFYVLTVLSNLSLMLNCVFHHVVTSQYAELGNGIQCFSYDNLRPWYQLHLYYCCILGVCNVLALAGTAFHTTSFYRKKYSIPLGMLIFTFVSEFVGSMVDDLLDLSMLVYMALAIFLTYYSIFYTEKRLINKTLAYVVKDSRSGVVCFDIEGKCIYANEEAMNIYNNPSDLSAMETIFHKETGGVPFIDLEKGTWNSELTVNGQKLHYQITFTKLYDDLQNYIGCFFSMHDKTEDVERYTKERYRATHDSLTQLSNREHFYERVMRVRKANPEKEYYMVCTDIKDFKLINDIFGFEKGNEILRQMASFFKSSLPSEVICGRLQSDRFGFFIPKECFSEEQIISCVNQAIRLVEDSEYQMHIHAGVYVVQPEDQDVSVICDRANMAITTVKNNYDCIIAYYDTKHMESMMREKHLVAEFDTALEEKQFVMYLQPQVAKDGTVLGAEALVRWQHPERGMIPPGEFIEVFEKAGLIHRLDEYIWNLAAEKLSEWKKRGKEQLHISVNISPKDFYYLDTYKIFTELVEKYDIAPQNLKLEITETALMMEQDKMVVLLQKLQQYGFCVEIDDFGSGYSSLNMLKDIPADVLKIDMGFLREIQIHDRTKIILAMVVNLAKRLQMMVISEGVENKGQLDYLKEAGCDIFQGYYFDRPIAVSEFETRYVV